MLLLVTSSACWNASRPDTLVESISPMRGSSENACIRVYRHRARGLERRGHGGAARADGGCDGSDLAGVVGVRRIAAALQRAGERVDVAAGVECGGIPRAAAEQRYIILKALLAAVVGAELAGGADCRAVLELPGPGRDRGAVPLTSGFDAEEVVGGAALRVMRHTGAPVRLQGGLGDEMARIDAELLAGFLGRGPQVADEARLGLGRGDRYHRASRGAIAGVRTLIFP